MEAQFTGYQKLLRHFYSRLTRHHPSSTSLNSNLEAMMAQLEAKDANQYHHIRSLKVARKASNLSVTARSLSNNRKSTSNRGRKIGQSEPLFESESFGHVFAFAYLYSIIQSDNKGIMKMLQTKINLFSQSDFKDKFEDKSAWEHNLMEWKKITHTIQHKNAVKWQKILQTSFMSFDANFLDMILKSILSVSLSATLQLKPTYDNLKKICSQLKISLILYYFEGDAIKDKKIVGAYKNTIKMIAEEKYNTFAFLEKIPGDEAQSDYYNEGVEKTPKAMKDNKLKSFNSVEASVKEKMNPPNEKNSEKSLKSLSQVKSAHVIQRMLSTGESPSPSKDSPGLNKKSSNYRLIARKTLVTVQFLLRQCNLNSEKLKNLECLDQQQSIYQEYGLNSERSSNLIQSKSIKRFGLHD